MIIQINTDNNITGSERQTAYLDATISEALTRFSDKISRLEVHLSDENSHKSGLNDKRCMLEARIEGMQPIAVTNLAGSTEQAIKGALDKLTASLQTIFGKLKTY
jgi:ribosome-associated translation inhibitor RaiA